MATTPTEEAELLTVDQVARVFGVHATTVRRWAATGRLPCIRMSNWYVRFRRADVERLLEPQEDGTP
jgi:excisionase family DNA binding protein